MLVEPFFYPPGVCSDLAVYGQSQPLLVLAYVTDGGDPVADETEVESVAAVDATWSCAQAGFLIHDPPCVAPPGFAECSDGTPTSAPPVTLETRNGLAVVSSQLGPFSSLKELHWEIDGVETDHVTFPTYTCTLTAAPTVCSDPDQDCVLTPTGDGCTNDRDYISGDPVLTGTAGEAGEILWEWEPPASLDARVPLEYGISVSAGTPSANPSNGRISGTSFLSTGLTDGVEYCARVQAFLAVGSGIASVPGSISNIACVTPTVVTGGVSFHVHVPLHTSYTASGVASGDGVGWWMANNDAGTGAQLVEAVAFQTTNPDAGYVGGEHLNYAAPRKVVYKIATHAAVLPAGTSNTAKDESVSIVNADELLATPAWIAKNPSGGANLHDFYGAHDGLFPDLGHAGYQAAAVTNAVGLIARNGPIDFYIDNMLGYATDGAGVPVYENVVPNGYADNRDWRLNAVIPFINAFCGGVHAAYPATKIIMSLYDIADTVEGETAVGGGWDQDTGETRRRYWAEIDAAAANAAEKPDGVFWEYFLQKPNGDHGPYTNEEDLWSHRWTSNMSRIAEAHALGYEFHGMNWNNHYGGTGTIGRFVRASAALAFEAGDIYWIADDPDDATPALTDPDVTRQLGVPLGPRQATGSLEWRPYSIKTPIVNPSPSDDTQTILGVSRFVAALSAVYV